MQIQDDPRNRETITALVTAFRRRQGIIPFVGAGLSVDFGFPPWPSFLRQAAALVGRRTEVEAALKGEDFERAAQHLEDTLGRSGFDRLIATTFGAAVEPAAAPEAAAHLLPELASGPVITTNFDTVLEVVFRSRGRAFDLPPLWGARTQIALDGIAEDYSLLLKIHGDALHGGDRVLTLREYERHYGSRDPQGLDTAKPLPNLLERLFASRSVLFLGCSLGPDRTIAILARVARASGTVPHFAVVQEPATHVELAERARFFRSLGILPIWYSHGCYELLRPFLEFLRLQIPPTAAGYGGIPSSVEVARSLEELRRTDAAREMLVTLSRERDRLLTEWDRTLDQDRRVAFFREHRDRIRDHWPRDFLRLVVEVVEEIRIHDPDRAAAYLISAHLAARSIGDAPAAVRFLRRATRLLEGQEPGIIHTDLLHTRALAAKASGAMDAAERFSCQSLRLAIRIRIADGFELRSMWHLRSNIMRELGKQRHSRRYLARALRSARRGNHSEALAHCWFSAANLYFLEDAPRRMERAARRAAHHASSEDIGFRATIFDNLGVGLYELGKLQEAVAAFREALWYEQQGSPDMDAIVITLMNFAWLEFNTYSGRAKLGTDVSDELRIAALHLSRDYYTQALVLSEASGDAEARAHVLTQRSLVLAALGDVSKALADLRVAIRFFRSRRDFSYLATALNNRGQIWDEQAGGMRRASRAYAAGLEAARRTGEVGILRTVLTNYVHSLERLGRAPEAARASRELARVNDRGRKA